MKKLMYFLIVLSLVCSTSSAHAERGIIVSAKKDSGSPDRKSLGGYYALIIGNNDYQHLPRLKTAVADAEEVNRVLSKKYGFKTTVLLNATRKEILSTINKFRKILDEKDNLLIYYAGHGEFDKATDKAYWLPVDASNDDPVDWIMADDITSDIKRITARHVLIVSDSCYSGALTRGATADLAGKIDRNAFLRKMIERPSRTLMASGGNEPVADAGGRGGHSVFASAFLAALNDTDADVFTADELFYSRVKVIVAGKSDQVPQYNNIRNSGDEGGDFIFILRRDDAENKEGTGIEEKRTGERTSPEKPLSGESAIVTQKDRMSYAIGVELGNSLKRESIDCDLSELSQGVHDSLSGAKLRLSETERSNILSLLMKVREEKKKLNVAIDQTVMDNFASLKKDDVSYAIGVDMGSKLMRNEIEVNGEILSKGIKDLLTNSALLMTDQEMKEAISIAQKELQAKKQEKTITLAEKNKSEGEAFLAANKNRDGVKTLSSGLQYKIFKNGSGKSPSEKDTVTVNYRGTFIDGTEFDSSYKRGQLATFPLSAVIKGWTEGLQYVKEGGKIQLVIPANLAYGEKGVGNIGPNAVLVFDVELIKINEK